MSQVKFPFVSWPSCSSAQRDLNAAHCNLSQLNTAAGRWFIWMENSSSKGGSADFMEFVFPKIQTTLKSHNSDGFFCLITSDL